MGFSYVLQIGGIQFERFGDVKISQNVDGYGTAGVATSEFDVTVTYDEYKVKYPAPNAPVVFYGGGLSLPTYFICSRSKKGGKVTFKCYDRMIFTDQTIDLTDESFKDDVISTSAVLNQICLQCGFDSYGTGGSGSVPILNLPKEVVYQQTIRTVLDTLSAAWCGYFKVGAINNNLLFIPFGGTPNGNAVSTDHSTIIEGMEKGPIAQLIVTGGDEVYILGSTGADVFSTLRVDTELATPELAEIIWQRVQNYTYSAWSCSKCICSSGILEVTCGITFADKATRIANNIVITPSAAGIFVECGRNDVIENEFDYSGALSRSINQRIKDGEKLGNGTMITRYQGLIHLGEKKADDSGNVTQSRYGYSQATADGVVKFGGAMVDSVMPDSITFDAAATSGTIAYQGKVLALDLEWDGNDNLIGIKQTEVE